MKAFDHFPDHRGFGEDADYDKFWSNSLFMMRGEKWRHMRATLSPAFTGSKMRHMFELVNECAVDAASHFRKRSENEKVISIEAKDIVSRYTNDVIATCAFGLKIDSFLNPDNEFYTNGRKLMDFSSLKRVFNLIMIMVVPKIAKALNITFSDQPVANVFRETILTTLKVRQENHIHRPDMINILMQIREGTLHHQVDEKKDENEGFATVEESDIGKVTVNRKWNDDEIVAQCFGFFIGGFDTTSNLLMFLAYELAVHPDIQQKLYEEIAQTNVQLGQKRLTYDAMQKMKYMDQVICEGLRKWPAIPIIDRLCSKDYAFDLGNSSQVKVQKGDFIQLTVLGIHHGRFCIISFIITFMQLYT